MKKLELIAAYDENKGVGINNSLPWHLPEDLKHFKALTIGKNIIMGRKTFDSLPFILPERKHIVLSSVKSVSDDPRVNTVNSLEECLSLVETINDHDNIVIGGPQIWKMFLPYVSTLYITKVKSKHIVDSYFPDFDENNYHKTILSESDDCLFLKFDLINKIF